MTTRLSRRQILQEQRQRIDSIVAPDGVTKAIAFAMSVSGGERESQDFPFSQVMDLRAFLPLDGVTIINAADLCTIYVAINRSIGKADPFMKGVYSDVTIVKPNGFVDITERNINAISLQIYNPTDTTEDMSVEIIAFRTAISEDQLIQNRNRLRARRAAFR